MVNPLSMATAGAVIEELRDALKEMNKSLDVLRTEAEIRRNLPVTGPLLKDQTVTFTVAAGEAKTIDLMQEAKRLGTDLRVVAQTAGALVGINGSQPTAVNVAQTRQYTAYIIATVRLDNTAGSGDLTVQVGLIANRATGRGAWA